MRGILCSFAILFVIILLSFYASYTEGFSSDVQMCGVDKAPCPGGLTCINGYCKDGVPPTLPTYTGLPVIP